MNSLNILSALGSPPLPPSQPVTHPEKEHREETEDQASEKGQGVEQENFGKSDTPHPDAGDYNQPNYNEGDGQDVITEKSPLLPQQQPTKAFDDAVKTEGFWKSIPKRIASAIIGSLRAVISTLIAPGYYIVAFFYKENGKLSTRSPLHRFGRIFRLGRRKGKAPSKEVPRIDGSQSKHDDKLQGPSSDKLSIVSTASSIGNSTESDIDTDIPMTPDDTPSRNTRSRKVSRRKGGDSEESERPRRIRVQGGESRKEQGSRRSKEKTQSDNLQFDSTTPETEAAAALLKSPKSPATGLKVTKYPKVPSPPQPLIPRRQPSYVFSNTSGASPNKTLIIDLDETLIHSMAKGGRMSTGHMVEVKLQHPVGIGGTTIGPQVPILYYVHKRPYCDEFLRKVSKWYNLIVFTASVQEYADPVIDWLEQERQYFSGRYYRQHCTFRNGAYIKDLSHIEPDLSKVMILDNSPMSYIFHEDNAIPIEGWISDPTDSDLLHLIPMMEALQYVLDVRAFLALRLGEPIAI